MIRNLAFQLFENPKRFLKTEPLEDFESARPIFEDCLDSMTVLAVVDVEETRGFLKSITDWPDFFQKLCKHDLLSSSVTASNGELRSACFHKLWQNIAGFDVDGLMEIGDPRPAARQKYSPKHDLGAKFLDADRSREVGARIFPEDMVDNHVHFGQNIDFNTIWLGFLNTEKHFSPELLESVYAQPQTKKPTEVSERTLAWLEGLSWARFLIRCWSIGDEGKKPIEKFLADEKFKSSYHQRVKLLDEWHTNLSKRFSTDTLLPRPDGEGSQLAIGSVEAQIFRSVSGDQQNLPSWKVSCALAYVIAKNAAFHRMLSNQVNSFETFTRILGTLDDVYFFLNEANLLDSRSVGMALMNNAKHSESHAESPIVLLRQNANTTGTPKILSRMRVYDDMRLESAPAGYTLGFHREDFNVLEEQIKQIPVRVDEIIKFADPPLQINAIDLCGPEIGGDQQSNFNMLIRAVDTVFEVRETVSKRTKRVPRVSFHVGEHTREDLTAMLSVLYVALHPKFCPQTDRFSHALVLTRGDVPVTSDVLEAQGDLIQKCICFASNEPPENATCLFGAEERKKITDCLSETMKNGNSAGVKVAATMVQTKVLESNAGLEICPFSNELMVSEVSAQNHPWKAILEKNAHSKVLIGTDDPSITQTLPWMERVFFSL